MDKVADWVIIYDNAIPDDLCDRMIALIDNTQTEMHDQEWRRCFNYNSLYTTNEGDEYLKHISRIYNEYTKKTNANGLYHIKTTENTYIYKYLSNSEKPHHFNEHSDNWDIQSATRQLSFIVYLNDVEVGGETTFKSLGISVKPKKGRVVVFPPFYLFPHRGEIPVSNDKYIAVTWLHFGGTGHYVSVRPL